MCRNRNTSASLTLKASYVCCPGKSHWVSKRNQTLPRISVLSTMHSKTLPSLFGLLGISVKILRLWLHTSKEKRGFFIAFMSIETTTFHKFMSPQSFPLLPFQTLHMEKQSYWCCKPDSAAIHTCTGSEPSSWPPTAGQYCIPFEFCGCRLQSAA